MKPPAVSVIIPCLNEEEMVPLFESRLLPGLERSLGDFEVVFVNDCSTDDTGVLLKILAAGRPNVRVIDNPGRLGFGESFRRAVAAARGGRIAALDADLSFDPAALAQMREAMDSQGADLVIGSPFRGSIKGMSPWRRLLTAAANRLLSLLFPGATSYTGILKLWRADRLSGLSTREKGFSVLAELTVLALRGGLRVVEVPADSGPRLRGRSKMRVFSELRNYAGLIARLKTAS